MRKKQAKKRPLLPDPRFNDQLVTRFVNMMMWDGKKSVAFSVFYDAIDIVEEKKTDEEKSALELWKDALVQCYAPCRSAQQTCGWSDIPNPDADQTRS